MTMILQKTEPILSRCMINYNNAYNDLIKNLKIVLHTYIYSNDLYMANLTSFLQTIDPFSIVYDKNNRTINIKMKKTSMKKYDNYNNSIEFYYTFFKQYIQSFLQSLLPDIIKCMEITYPGELSNKYIEDTINNNILSFFTLTLLSDNFIIIHL